MGRDMDEIRPPQVVGPGEGRTLMVAGVRVTLKLTGEETGGACTLVELTLPPHFSGHGLWVHRQTSALVYVVRGELACTLGEATRWVPAGGVLLVPPGTVYRCWNPTAAPARCLVHLTPAGLEHLPVELAAHAAQWPPTGLAERHGLAGRYDLFTAG